MDTLFDRYFPNDSFEIYDEIPFITCYMDFKIENGIVDEISEAIKSFKNFYWNKTRAYTIIEHNKEERKALFDMVIQPFFLEKTERHKNM